MKAKELAAIYNADPDGEGLDQMCKAFFADLRAVTKARKPQTDVAALAILREMQIKWKAVARHTNGALVENGFDLLIKLRAPELYRVWKQQ